MMKFNQQIDICMYASEVGTRPTEDFQMDSEQLLGEEDPAVKSLLDFVDQQSGSKMKKFDNGINALDISPDDMSEALEYYRRYHRPVIEAQFMDYKGQQLDTFTDEQFEEVYKELRNALYHLPIPPNVFMYDQIAFTAVWEIPEQRRFLSNEEFYLIRDNFVDMIHSNGISTPIPTEDFYDSELKFEYLPMAQLYKNYQEKIKPLQLFDQISGLKVCVTDAKHTASAKVLRMVERE